MSEFSPSIWPICLKNTRGHHPQQRPTNPTPVYPKGQKGRWDNLRVGPPCPAWVLCRFGSHESTCNTAYVYYVATGEIFVANNTNRRVKGLKPAVLVEHCCVVLVLLYWLYYGQVRLPRCYTPSHTPPSIGRKALTVVPSSTSS